MMSSSSHGLILDADPTTWSILRRENNAAITPKIVVLRGTKVVSVSMENKTDTQILGSKNPRHSNSCRRNAMLSKFSFEYDTVRASKLIFQVVDPTPQTTAQLMIAAIDSTRSTAIKSDSILPSDKRKKANALHLLPTQKEGQTTKNTPVNPLEIPKSRYTMPALLTANPNSCILNTKKGCSVVRMIWYPAMPDENLTCFIVVEEDVDSSVLFIII